MRIWPVVLLVTCCVPVLLCAEDDAKEIKDIANSASDLAKRMGPRRVPGEGFPDPISNDASGEKFHPGERVKVDDVGQKFDAVVVSQDGNWVELKYSEEGKEVVHWFPNDWVSKSIGSRLGASKSDVKKSGKRRNMGVGGRGKVDKPPIVPEEIRFRLWADKSGKFQVKAKFIELKDDKVRLEQENGKTISIDLEELADVDRTLAEKLSHKDDPPAPPKGKPGPAGEAPILVESDDALKGDAQEVSWTFTKLIEPKFSGSWALESDGPPDGGKPLTAKAVKLFSTVKSKDFHDSAFWVNVDTVLFARDRGLMCIASIDKRESIHTANTVLQRVDLENGKVLETVEFPGDLKALAIDPAGRRVMTSAGKWPSDISPRLSLWEFGSGKAQHVATWSPRPLNESKDEAIEFGMMVDVSHGITVASYSTLVGWKLGEHPSPEYRIQLAGGRPALSPGRKQLAVATKDGIFLVDPKSGETLASLPGQPGEHPTFAFSPDGRKLAGLSYTSLTIWNLENGERYRELPIERQSTSFLDWVSDKHILLDSKMLIDVEKRISLWEYKNGEARYSTRTYGEMGGIFWHVLTSSDHKERGVFGVALPHDEAKAAAGFINTDDLLVLKKGTPVCVTVAVQGTDEEKLEVKQNITAKLKELGLDVVETAALNFWAKTEASAPETVTYAPWGTHDDKSKHESVTVRGFKNSLTLHEGDKILWESARYSGGATTILATKGQSLQQAINPWQKPDLTFYKDVKIPRDILRTNQSMAAGASEFTHRGLEPAQLTPQATNTLVPDPGIAPIPQRNAEPRRRSGPRRNLGPKINVDPKLNPAPKQNLVRDDNVEPENNVRPVIEAPPKPAVEPEADAEQKPANDRPIRKRR